MPGVAIITEACIDVKDRACVDVCPVQCIYEYDPATNTLVSEVEAGNGIVENSHQPDPAAIEVFADSTLYVNTEECTSCTACYQPDVCPVGAIYSEEHVPDGSPREVQLERSEQGPRPHVLHRTEPRGVRRLRQLSGQAPTVAKTRFSVRAVRIENDTVTTMAAMVMLRHATVLRAT